MIHEQPGSVKHCYIVLESNSCLKMVDFITSGKKR